LAGHEDVFIGIFSLGVIVLHRTAASPEVCMGLS